jgi:hypothetical protein
MYVNIQQWREYIPWSKTDLHMATNRLGSPVSVTTITAMERGQPVTRIKAQAVIDALNSELLRRGKLQEPLQLKDVEKLQIA